MHELNDTIKPLQDWGMFDTFPVVISGPCSAETKEQVLATAKGLENKDKHVQIFRAGVWKPRTRPGSFEGVGVEALPWLTEVKKETGYLTCVEVATANHVYESLKHNVDILWLGARTTVNPFAVQEIADAIKGIDIPVMIKNPINPDFKLWLGAIERIAKSGIDRIAGIHRGFSSATSGRFRNAPMWAIPIEMKRTLPNMAMICDPSHICGKRDLLQDVSQTSLDLAFDGLMIEAHPDPEKAWSDAAQQVTPDNLMVMLDNLKLRDTETKETNMLEVFRSEIDSIDTEIMDALAKRISVVEKIAQHKKDKNLSILQMNRWEALLNEKIGLGQRMGLEADFIKKIYQEIHINSIKTQKAIITSKGDENS